MVFIGHILGFVAIVLLLMLWRVWLLTEMMDDMCDAMGKLLRLLSDEQNKEKVICGFSDNRCDCDCNHTHEEGER